MIPKPPRRVPAARKPLRRTRVAKKPKHSAKKVRAEADRLWSLLIRRPGRCYLCGAVERLQGAHLVSRRYHATRWRLDNGWCLCSSCHVRYTYDPLGWDVLLEKHLGAEKLGGLKRDALAGGSDPAAALEALREFGNPILKS